MDRAVKPQIKQMNSAYVNDIYVASVRPFTLLWSGIILKQMVVHSCQVGVVIDDIERVIFIRGK